MFGWLSGTKQKEKGLQQAEQLAKAGKIADAVVELDGLKAKFPDDSQVALIRGIYLKALDRYDEALVDLERIKKPYADDSGFWEALGEVLMSLKRFDQAVPPLDRALELKPDRPNARLWRAISLRAVGRNRDALQDCEFYVAARPDEPTGHFIMAMVYEDMWEPDQGLKAAERSLQLNPKHAKCLASKARMLCQAQRPVEAVAAIDAAIAAGFPENELRSRRAGQLVDVGRFADALPLLNQIINEHPTREWHMCRARAHEGLGDPSRAAFDRRAGAQIVQNHVNELRFTGVPRNAVLIQAGDHLYSAGDRDGCALVLLTFDDALNADTERQSRLANALFALRSKPLSDDPVLRAATNAVTNDEPHRNRRQLLPVELTEGVKCYAADLIIYRDFLPEARLACRVIPVLAESGDKGRIEMLPLPGSLAAS